MAAGISPLVGDRPVRETIPLRKAPVPVARTISLAPSGGPTRQTILESSHEAHVGGYFLRSVTLDPTSVRLLFAILAISFVPVATADERIRMVGPSSGEEAAKELMESVAASCNELNYQEFMTHFTPTRAASIRKKMKEVFSQHDIEMEIQEVKVVSESDEKISFDLQYGWRDKNASPQVLYSEVVAAKTNNGWKIASEKVKRTEVQAPPEQRFDFGGGGQVVLNADEDFWLPRDIAKRPGGCVGGQCGVGK